MQASAFGSASFHVLIRAVLMQQLSRIQTTKSNKEGSVVFRPPDSVLTHLQVKFEYLFVFLFGSTGFEDLSCGMWGSVPRPGIKPASPFPQRGGTVLATGPPEKTPFMVKF